MNTHELAKLDKMLDAILADNARTIKTVRRENKGSAAMLAYARACADKADAVAYFTQPDELPYGAIEGITRRMAFENE